LGIFAFTKKDLKIGRGERESFDKKTFSKTFKDCHTPSHAHRERVLRKKGPFYTFHSSSLLYVSLSLSFLFAFTFLSPSIFLYSNFWWLSKIVGEKGISVPRLVFN